MHAFSLAFPGALITYICAAAWWLAPALRRRPKHDALAMLCSFHGLRAAFGMTLLAPGAADPAVPPAFRAMVAYGDFASALLALIAAALLRREHALARPATWLFSIVGMADLANAVYQGSTLGVFEYPLGAAWIAVTIYVPALWVTHIMVVVGLRRR